MASIFWHSQEVTKIDYLKQGHTINCAYYAGELRRLSQENARKWWGKLTHGVLLLQDNTPAHTLQVAMTAATEYGFEIHPPSSNFYLFQKLKSHLRGTQYGSNTGVVEYLGDLEKAFHFEGIRNLEQRWAKCIALKRNYIVK